MHKHLLHLTFLFLLQSYNCWAQEEPFIIIEKQAKEEVIQKRLAVGEAVEKKILYEDENYEVTSSCKGEWGGSVLFKNKKTGLYYAATATCVVAVHQLEGNYYITNSLAHLAGSMDVFRIDHPEDLLPVKVGKNGKIDHEAAPLGLFSTKGTTPIIDSIGITCTGSFPYQGKLYYIINSHQGSFLSTVSNQKLVTVQQLSSTGLWTYNPRVLQLGKEHHLMFFQNKKAIGCIENIKNKISILREK